MQRRIPATLMRGGTSKGLFFCIDDIPHDTEERDRVLLKAVGAPGPGQADGVGGRISSTRKIAILGESAKPDHDVDYTFGQIGTTRAYIDYDAMCGNLVAAAAVFALETGMVSATEPVTTVRIFNTNLGRSVIVKVPVSNGNFLEEGDFIIAGGPSSGAAIEVEFVVNTEEISKGSLPTGLVVDHVDLAGETFEITVIDVGNPTVLIELQSLRLNGLETTEDLAQNNKLLEKVEQIRSKAAELIGLVSDWRQATDSSPTLPMVIGVGPTRSEQQTGADRADFATRTFISQRPHHAIPLTGLISAAAAACLEETIANRILNWRASSREVAVGHPGGVSNASVKLVSGIPNQIASVSVIRTARTIMNGNIYVPETIIAP